MDIHNELLELRIRAQDFKRHSDIDLYQFLSRCLRVCEQDETTIQRIREQHWRAADAATAAKLKRLDVFGFVIRHVFSGVDMRTSLPRYARVLREAFAMQLQSNELTGWLRNNGGLRTLETRNRPVARVAKTRILRLTTPIEVTTREYVTLTLWRRADGTFDVVTTEAAQTASCDAFPTGVGPTPLTPVAQPMRAK